MTWKPETLRRGQIVDGKRYCKWCEELHELHVICDSYGLKEIIAVNKYRAEINGAANRLMQKKPK